MAFIIFASIQCVFGGHGPVGPLEYGYRNV